MVLVGWLVAFVACCFAGWRLRSPAARPLRVARAAAWLSLCCALPFVPQVFLPLTWRDESLPLAELLGVGAVGESRGVHGLVSVLAFVFMLRLAWSVVRLPGPWGGRDALPEIDDPGLRARVQEVAEAVGAPRPRILRLGSAGGMLETQAFAHGVVAPTLIVSDGILHRLDAGERDAVLGHELAHLRRRSLPKIVLLASVALTAGVLASSLCPGAAAFVWGILLLVGLRRVFGHVDEVACDVLAGRAAGFGRMADALDKIHGSRLPDDDRWLSRWIHATQSHPARTVRLWALRRAAPPDAAAAMAVDEQVDREVLARHRRTYLLAWVGWFALVVFGLWWAVQPGQWLWATGSFAAAIALPWVLLVVASFRELVWAAQLGLLRVPWRGLLDFACLVGALVIVVAFTDVPLFVRLALLAVALVLACSLLVRRMLPSTRRRKQLDVKWRRQDYAGFEDHVRSLSRRAQREPLVRYLVAVARAARGGREAAAKDLLALAEEKPRMRAALLTASALLRPVDPERSLAVAERLVRSLPNNPYALGRLAAARLRTGDVDGARQTAEAGLRVAPRAGVLHALAARIALRAGDHAAATDHLALAERWASGDVHVLLARAEHARATGGDFEQVCARLREASRHQLLAFADDEVAALL